MNTPRSPTEVVDSVKHQMLNNLAEGLCEQCSLILTSKLLGVHYGRCSVMWQGIKAADYPAP